MRRNTTRLVFALTLTCIAPASVAQDAGSCVDEVQRLDEGLPVIHDPATAAAIAQEPGARKGASLGEEQRRQVSALIQQARKAGEEGDGGGCMQSLTEARVLLREAGFGSGEPGSASDERSGTGRLGTDGRGMAGGAGLLAPARDAGAPTTGTGGATTDMGPAATAAGAAPRGSNLNRTATGDSTRGSSAAGGGASGGAAR
jgi:hypothetical protein